MNQHIRQTQYKKGFANIAIVVLVVVLVGVMGYFTPNNSSKISEKSLQGELSLISFNGKALSSFSNHPEQSILSI